MSSNKKYRNPNWHWTCGICHEDHPIKLCQRFIRSSPFQRFEAVVNKHYCQNCLARSHLTAQCQSKLVCFECSRRHHTLLHGAPQLVSAARTSRPSSTDPKPKDLKIDPTKKKTPDTPATKESTKKTEMTSPQNKSAIVDDNQFAWAKVFVPTATIKITHNKMAIWYPVRAVLNESLTISRVSRSCVNKLILPTKQIDGFQFAKFQIKSHIEHSRWTREIKALVTDELPKRPYSGPIKKDPSKEFNKKLLADINLTSNGQIDIELGSDLYPAIRRDGVLDSSLENVIAMKTSLGYVFCGPAEELDRY